MKKLVIITLGVFALSACKKIEGQGGRSSVSGKIAIEEKLYVNGTYQETVNLDGAKEDVYIVYGDADLIYDDKMECNYDGTFKFDYLEPGTYTIFAYSKIFHTGSNLTNNDDDYYTLEAVKQTIEVGKKESTDIGTITLTK
jgi:hypothetical protein